MAGPVELRTIETDIPSRMDRLPWSRWHWLVVPGRFGRALKAGVAAGRIRRVRRGMYGPPSA